MRRLGSRRPRRAGTRASGPGANHLRITRKTLLSLVGEPAAEPAEPPAVLPGHPAYQQILTVFADAGRPMRARDLCQALDLPIAPKSAESMTAGRAR